MARIIDSLVGNLKIKQDPKVAVHLTTNVKPTKNMLMAMSSNAYNTFEMLAFMVITTIEIGKNMFVTNPSNLASNADPRGGPSGMAIPTNIAPKTWTWWK